MTTPKKRDLTHCQISLIPTNKHGFAPDEVERLMELRRKRLEKFKPLDPYRY